MYLTCHFVDSNWKLHKRILNFCIVDNHKGKTIGKMVESCFEDWNTEDIFTLSMNNASSNDMIIEYLKKATKMWKSIVLGLEFLHMRCCAHILNFIGLKKYNKSN